jgi:alpha-D-xyloside xylohydrolase
VSGKGLVGTVVEVRHYWQAEGRFLLDDDDGETYDYEQGSYAWTELGVTRDAKGTLTGGSRILKENPIRSYGELHWRSMTP